MTPRKKGNASVKGTLFVNEGIWNLRKMDLTFNPDALKLFDSFRLEQVYEQVNDSLWFAFRQDFSYSSKQNKDKTYFGKTTLQYSDFQPGFEFLEKHFGNEVSRMEQEALERDSLYWKEHRKDTLTKDQVGTVSRLF